MRYKIYLIEDIWGIGYTGCIGNTGFRMYGIWDILDRDIWYIEYKGLRIYGM